MNTVGTTPKRTRGSLTEHSSIGHVAHPTFCPDSLRGARDTLKLFIRMTHTPLSGPSASVLDKSLGRVSQAIIIHTTKSMLNGTLLSHFGQPITTCTPPPVERQDKDDGKSSLP